MDTEALGKRDYLLHRVVTVDIVTVTVGKALLYKVAAVRGGIDNDIARLCRHRALKDSLERRIVIVILSEGKVVNKDDKL